MSGIRISLTERKVIAPGTDAPYRYAGVDSFEMDYAPVVGDTLIWGSVWVVIGRQWGPPQRGSYSAIHGEGPILDLMVEPSPGFWPDEAELTDEERDSAD